MIFFKARYLKDDKPHGKAYTFKADFDVNPGDVVRANGKRVMAIADEVDNDFIQRYGKDKITVVVPLESEEEDGK